MPAIGLLVIFAPVILLLWTAVFGSSKRPTSDAAEPCRHCGYDVRGGLLLCPECGKPTQEVETRKLAKLREDWPNESISPRSPAGDEFPVIVLTTDNHAAASLLREHLEARGIRAELSNPSIGGATPYQQKVTSFRLSVWSEDQERAKAIIARLWPSTDNDAKA